MNTLMLLLAASGAVVTVTSVAVAAFYAFRNREGVRAAEQAAEAWRRERDAEVAYRERLAAKLEEAHRKIAFLERRVDELSRELQQRPDLTTLERRLARHDERSEKQAEKIVAALAAIAERLDRREERG